MALTVLSAPYCLKGDKRIMTTESNTPVKQARKLSMVVIAKNGKVDTYRQVVNQVKRVCTVDGSKRGASLNLFVRPIYLGENDEVVALVFSNKPLTTEQASTFWKSMQ